MNFNISRFRNSKSNLHESKYKTKNLPDSHNNFSFHETNSIDMFNKKTMDTSSPSEISSSQKNKNYIIMNKFLPLYFEEKNNHLDNTNDINSLRHEAKENIYILSHINKNISINKLTINHIELTKDQYIYYPNEGTIYIFLNLNDGIYYENILQIVFFVQIVCENVIHNSCLNKTIQSKYYYRGYYKYH